MAFLIIFFIISCLGLYLFLILIQPEARKLYKIARERRFNKIRRTRAETEEIKREARNRGETSRVFRLSNESKIFIFYKDGQPVRSAIRNSAWNTLDYYNHKETQNLIKFWQKLGKIPNYSK